MNMDIDLDNLNKMNLTHKLSYSDGEYYQSFQYDKGMLCYNDEKRSLHRQTWLSYPDNKLLSISIPKSLHDNEFKTRYPVIDENILVVEHIEGELLSLYYDKRINKWKLTMDNNLSNPHIVLSIFYDIFNTSDNQTLNDIAMLNYFAKDYSYTFILKIPSINLYRNIKEPELYLISVYKIEDRSSEYISPIEYENWSIFKEVNNIIKMPQYYNIDKYSELSERELSQTYGTTISGMIVKNIITGELCKILTSQYKLYIDLLRIEPIIRYKYLCIIRIGKINEYIKVYPNIKNEFLKMKDIYNQFINCLYYAYNNKYKYKLDNQYDTKINTIIRKIHQQIYMSQPRENSIAINRNTIKKYMNSCDPNHLYYLLHCTV